VPGARAEFRGREFELTSRIALGVVFGICFGHQIRETVIGISIRLFEYADMRSAIHA
jgi:carbamoylphosphate synthase small subunit